MVWEARLRAAMAELAFGLDAPRPSPPEAMVATPIDATSSFRGPRFPTLRHSLT